MLWLAVDVLIALFAVGFLLLVLLRLWRALKAFSRAVGDASTALGAAGERLADAQAQAPRHR